MIRNENPFREKMNLQFFAKEPEPAPNPEPTPEPTPNPEPEPQLSAEEQLQQALVEIEKLKRAQEKAATEEKGQRYFDGCAESRTGKG